MQRYAGERLLARVLGELEHSERLLERPSPAGLDELTGALVRSVAFVSEAHREAERIVRAGGMEAKPRQEWQSLLERVRASLARLGALAGHASAFCAGRMALGNADAGYTPRGEPAAWTAAGARRLDERG